MGGSSAKITNAEQKANSIRFQSSMFGGVVALLHGTNRVPPNLLEYGDFRATEARSTESSGGKGGGGVETTTVWYTYTASSIFGLVEGPIISIGRKWQGKRVYAPGEDFQCTDPSEVIGTIGQAPWSVLATMHGGTHELGYSGLALYCVQDYYLGTEATVLNHGIEVHGVGSGAIHYSIDDCLPDVILSDWVSSDRRGLGVSGILANLDNYADYCKASGLWFSPLLLEQAPAADRFDMLQRISNSVMVEMDGQIHMVPLGAEAVSTTVAPGETYTWTPSLAPVYELTPDQLMPRGDDMPLVGIERMTPADAYNIVEVEYSSRGDDYSPAIARKVDQASIDLYGERPAPKLVCNWITTADVADRVAQLELNRHMQLMNTYTFDLPWNFADVIPTSLVELSSPDQDLDSFPVRVRKRTERDDGFTFEAEDFPASLSAQPLHVLPVMDGFRNDYGADPGDTTVHAVFEAPKGLASGLELWIACTGSDPDWGGCNVWISADGSDYRQVGTVVGASRVGQFELSASDTASLFKLENVSGQLGSGTALDASLNTTLCWADGEFFSYETATLTAAGKYTLNGLSRGVYGSRRSAKSAGSPFVRCDGALGKTGPIGIQMVGRQIWIKCQSINIFALATQDLAAVTAVTYTPTGELALAPDQVANLVPEGEFSLLPLGRKPDTWDGGVVTAVVSQPAFTAALDCSALLTQGLSRIKAEPGESFWVSAVLDTSGSSTGASVGMSWFDASGTFLSFGVAGVALSAGSAWAAGAGVVVAPASAFYGVPGLQRSASGGTGVCRLADVVVVRQAQTRELADQSATEVSDITASSFTWLPGSTYSGANNANQTAYAVAFATKGSRLLAHLSFNYSAINTTGSSINERSRIYVEVYPKKTNSISGVNASITTTVPAVSALFYAHSSVLGALATYEAEVKRSWTATANEDCYVFFKFVLGPDLPLLPPGGPAITNQAKLVAENLSLVMEAIKK